MDEKAFREIREIEVELTAACTRSCAFCAPGLLEGRREASPSLGRLRFFDLVDELASLQYDGVLTFCGWGEPTLHEEFEDFVADAWRRLPKARLRIFTNGDYAAKALRALAFFDEVRVSVYEPQGWDIVLFERLLARGRHPGLRIDDHRGHGPIAYTTRAGNVKPYPPEYEVRLARRRHTPCEWFRTQLFLSAEGHWVTCCNDMKQIHTWEGGIADLFSDPDYLAMRRALADPAVDRRTLEPCSKCESA
ncbi:MAG TPA: radical SAM protein [Phycisphaerae bacterium]|nr:radical SAM protein [Phycisphaerae bacterium]